MFSCFCFLFVCCCFVVVVFCLFVIVVFCCCCFVCLLLLFFVFFFGGVRGSRVFFFPVVLFKCVPLLAGCHDRIGWLRLYISETTLNKEYFYYNKKCQNSVFKNGLETFKLITVIQNPSDESLRDFERNTPHNS